MTAPESPLAAGSDPGLGVDPVAALGVLAAAAGAAVGGSARELVQVFTADTCTAVRHTVRDYAEAAGLACDALYDFVVAVHELVINAVRHGGGHGRLWLRRDGDTLLCDVADSGDGFPDGVPVTTGPLTADVPGGRGILLARQLTDTLLITDGLDGVTATVTACLSRPAAPAELPAELTETDQPGGSA